jgi:hypothetical protein
MSGFKGLENGQAVICVTREGSRLPTFWVTMELGKLMRYSTKHILAGGCLCAAVMAIAACSPRKAPPLTIEDLMEDRVALDGILMKCDQHPKSRDSADCENARIAIERLAAQNIDPAVEKKRQADFEHAREQLRLTQERARQEQEAKKKVDAYTLPVVPVEPAKAAPSQQGDPSASSAPQANAGSQSGALPATAGTTTP